MAMTDQEKQAAKKAQDEAVAAAVKAEREKAAEREAELKSELEAAQEAKSSSSTSNSSKASTSTYELVADNFHEQPKDGVNPRSFVKGDKVELTDEQAERLLDAGAVKKVGAKSAADERGGDTKAPESK